ncbi:S-adenosyl-L-methionine-dependent methyltransferase [Gymnopilus junonius]|uniref:S-adenosyl-L-methionine-dependent methyltransferase n=1 Tax=Gymnopilus junonius TaxID=109634 RepID=A0A9P5NGB2_GYMJU|nr:S-adenosyl-L-methionine-dependent methyltransferase [Gymnopilus junonius]
MRLLNAFSFLTDLRLAFFVAIFPTLKALLNQPTLLLRPHALSQVFMSHVWTGFADGTDENGRKVKDGLITPNAYGVVLDIGAGHGHTVRYLNHACVSRYVALEPNTLMHDKIRTQANAGGFHESDGTLVILSCGVEDTKTILSTLSSAHSPTRSPPPISASSKEKDFAQTHQELPSIDTIISVLTLCTIPDPQKNMARLVRDVLKPGGQLLIYEHVLSPRQDVAWWQKLWAPIWAVAFDGCRMDRPSDVWVGNLKLGGEDGVETSAWRESRMWGKEGEDPENLFWHSVGRFVKR